MTSIDRASALAALIKAQLAAQRDAGPQAGAMGAPGKAAPTHAPKQQARPDAKHGAQPQARLAYPDAWVTQQVRHLSPDDPRRRRKAFRFFLEAVLGQEFGPELAGSASFSDLVGQVLARMESDDELTTAMDEAGEQLLAQAGLTPRPG